MPSLYNLKNQANAISSGSRDPAVKELAKVVHELCKLVEEVEGKARDAAEDAKRCLARE